MREVRLRNQGLGHARLAIIILIGLFVIPLATSIIITPRELFIDDYATTQETIITFYNDQFDPVGCELTPDYLSTYLLPYVTFEPSRFILQPDMQQNVRVTTNFPADFPPQTHELTIAAFRDAAEKATIKFRPPGEQRFSLAINEATAELSDKEEELTITLQIKNNGNLVLFVKPQFIIKKEGMLIKDVTYPQPVIVQPGETYPLTIRQDMTGLGAGAYGVDVQAHYEADGHEASTPAYPLAFSLSAQAHKESKSPWDRWRGVIIGAAAAVMAALWFMPAKLMRWRRGKEKHITAQKHELLAMQQEMLSMQGEVTKLSKETRLLVEEAERWLQQRRGAA